MTIYRQFNLLLRASPGTRAMDLPPEWVGKAACASIDPALFYPKQGETTLPARRICASCPVRVACLTYALDWESRYDTPAPYGVWGGMTAARRKVLIAKRRRAAS